MAELAPAFLSAVPGRAVGSPQMARGPPAA